MLQLSTRQKRKHFVTTERTVSRRPAAMAAVTMRVTARLMPEVDSVTVSIKTEKISWYRPMPSGPIFPESHAR